MIGPAHSFSTVITSPQNPSQNPLPLDGSNAFAAAVDGRKQQPGRNQSSPSPGSARGGNSSRVCSFCGWSDHTSNVCYEKHGYPPEHPRYPGGPLLPTNGSATSTTGVDAASSSTRALTPPEKGAIQSASISPLGLIQKQHNVLLAFLDRAEAHNTTYRDQKALSTQIGFFPSPNDLNTLYADPLPASAFCPTYPISDPHTTHLSPTPLSSPPLPSFPFTYSRRCPPPPSSSITSPPSPSLSPSTIEPVAETVPPPVPQSISPFPPSPITYS
ncbi:hypothetical protein PIB30_088725 [Stylosanthes scabra]|uniref:Uncharacterized protein n=1 Tax=Stylosanthes scabra TaxID=79078 RepID=A0ABU6SU53_9FABA|nr:hypothetical protein [Stylosanthes scabra]